MTKLINQDCLQYMKTLEDNSVDLIFTDPPYALGSEIIIKADGKPDYKQARDFMNKWDMPTGEFWEEWYKEAYRVLKHGGHCLMFGMDRQLLLFKYYGHTAGFTEKQSLYWYFISNFPKASDLSKNIDKRFGLEREVVGVGTMGGMDKMGKEQGYRDKEYVNEFKSNIAIHPLAQKYNGLKYSIAPLKQTNETIMVFQKPYKHKSCLNDVLAYEEGENDITVGAINIEGCRVATSEYLGRNNNARVEGTSYVIQTKTMRIDNSTNGRFPAQTYIGGFNLTKSYGCEGSIGGASRILHKCEFEKGDYDIYHYCPKVSKRERNEGLDNYVIIKLNKGELNQILCEKNTGLEELLKKAILDLELKNFSIGMSGENITVQCHKDTLSTIKTMTKQTIELKIWNWLMHSLTNGCTLDVKLEMENGSSLAQNVENLKDVIQKTGTGQREVGLLLVGASLAMSSVLSFIKEKSENEIEPMLNQHVTLKPTKLLSNILKLFKTPNPQTILDPFMGSGSMGISAIQQGYDYIGVELSEEYFRIAEARINHAKNEKDKTLL